MKATNMAQLKRMLQKEIQKAMNVASEKMLAETQGEVWEFYTEGSPEQYERTGALGDSPRTTPITNSGNTSEFEVYLDNTHEYTTGTYTMEEVLSAAEDHTSGVLGKPHFWERSKEKMEDTLNNVMGSFFEKL